MAEGRGAGAVTKMGSGEKDPAYVIKQNLFMKITLGVVGVLLVLTVVLCFSVLEVKVQRRSSVKVCRPSALARWSPL